MSLPFSLAVAQPLSHSSVGTVAREARRLVAREVAAARAALARELPSVTLAAGRPVHLSPVLADLVRAALEAARLTDGAVDPTVGAALLHTRPWLPACGSAVGLLGARRHSWRDVRLDGRWLTLPRTVLLDLNATAAARTADRCATLVTTRFGVGARVSVAGDVATCGPAPAGGWPVPGWPGTLPAGRSLGTSRAPLVDPATGRPAPRTWTAVTVEAADALTASALAKAADLRPDTPLPPGTRAHTVS
ncbi:FAD:protein FMN transferase [Phytohabitans houttuyneae]|uniref:FAD:protein FMN transferase n=1 Tax=Phytohabitans houttuyneae TaxID=1076126 RepID=UPI0031EED7FC